jgi:endonuclease YncB( thermonuclease family)
MHRPRRVGIRGSLRQNKRLAVLGVIAGAVGLGWLLARGGVDLGVLRSPGGWPGPPAGEVCRVEQVLDGDSLRVRCASGPAEVRLHCIDAPERDQVPWAKQSRRHLRELASTEVRLVELERDRFGRLVAEVYGSGAQRPLLNLEQVRSGHAAVYRRYCADPRYERAEREAQKAGRGIWSRPGEHQTPWVFRQRKRP